MSLALRHIFPHLEDMKVFISWSGVGSRSQKVAELLDGWLRCVIQAAKPWVSTQGIDRGAVWFSQISEQLKETSIGIICLTAENKEKPWIMFEAGALAKGLSQARVCPLLIELEPSDVKDPLAQFNMVSPNKQGMFQLVQTLNASLIDPLQHETLKRVFDINWSDFEKRYKLIISETPSSIAEPERDPGDMIAEILQISRSLQRRVRNLESRSSEYEIDHIMPGMGSSAHFRPNKLAEEFPETIRQIVCSGKPHIEIVNSLMKIEVPHEVIANLMKSELNVSVKFKNNRLISIDYL